MASVAVIGGALGGLIGLCVIITVFLLVYCFYLKRKSPKNIDEETKNPENDYFEAIDFTKIRKNKSQEQRNHIQPSDTSLVQQTKATSTDLVIDNVEYFNTMQVDRKTLNGNEISKKNGGKRSEIETGSHGIHIREDFIKEFEANEYFVLEKENTTAFSPEENVKEAKIKVNSERTNPSGENVKETSYTDKEENCYINQGSDRSSERVKDEMSNDNMYFVLEKC